MKSSILISRIMRVVETEGVIGEGAALAEEYSSAVRTINSRLEAVQAAIDAKQVSDAVRMMEDAPRLLDEVSSLDFNQLPDWEVLCGRNGWSAPVKIDKALLERVLMLNESTEVVEPFLRMYRKAVRTNNNQLAVQSLRRLVQLDHSQNWTVNLVQAEEAVQKQLVADFRAAKASGKVEEMDRIAQELLDTEWSEPPTSRGVEEIRAYIADKEAKQRDVEGMENLTVLRRCMSENWNLPLASSMLRAIDLLLEKGFAIPESDQEMIMACRKRCADEMEAEAKELRWKDLCEQLHAAIQREESATIRDVLSAPDFIDREPDPDLIRQAQLVIEHEEASRKRRSIQIATCALLALFAILGVSGWWLRQKLFNDRCEGEAVKLAALQKGSHAVERLSEALARLQEQDPEVYADPRVNVFVGRQKTLQSQFVARTNEIAVVLAELRGLRDSKWGESIDAVTSRIGRVDQLMTKDDDALRVEFLALKSAWTDYREEVDAANRNTATKFHETLISHINTVSNRLKSEVQGKELGREVLACKASISEWRRVHAQYVPALEGDVSNAEKNLGEAENCQKNLQSAIKAMKTADSAKSYLEARKTLLDYYSNYPFVKAIGVHPISPEDAEAVVTKTSKEQKAYADVLAYGVSDSVFKSFITDSVLGLADIPSYYSLYGVQVPGWQYGSYYFAVCKGKPKINGSKIEGELLDLEKGEMVQRMSKANSHDETLPPSDEIKNIVDFAGQPNLTLLKFEKGIVGIIAAHLKTAQSKNYLKNEIDVYGKQYSYAAKRYPAIRRVQLLQLYFKWLRDDLRLMPKSGSLARWFDSVATLAQPVRIDKIPEDLSWTCMREDRIRQRNTDCAKLLSRMAEEEFLDEYRAWKGARNAFNRIADWNIEFVGSVLYDPNIDQWMQDHSLIYPDVRPEVKIDHPLYVLRRTGDKLVFVRALTPHGNASGWSVVREAKGVLVPGDPLFQISERGVGIDAEEVIDEIRKGVPPDVARHFVNQIPLFNVEVK